MEDFITAKNAIADKGFAVINNCFTVAEVDNIIGLISEVNTDGANFRKSSDLFAIRQFLKEVPQIAFFVFTPKFISLISELFGNEYFVVKSIYFDKPGESNWFVAWHQDLTISVDRKIDVEGFGPWTVKQNQFAVQPPFAVLNDNFTIRIHLDDTDENNGALKVIPASHLKNIYRPETINYNNETIATCNVKKGGIMIMKPLLMHASSRTVNENKRRVIHIEFSRSKLPVNFNWSEYMEIPKRSS